MEHEPPRKRFKVSREGTGQANVKIEQSFTNEEVKEVIAGAAGLPSEAGNISLVDADGDQVLMSFKSLKSDVEYTVHHHPPKTSALPDPKCETIEVPKLTELKAGELLDVSSFKQLCLGVFFRCPTVFFPLPCLFEFLNLICHSFFL